MKIMHIVGARPNYMKAAPLMAEMARFPELFRQVCVHTGQHYDDNMSRIFFEDLDMPAPDHYLQVGAGSHAAQTARIMLAFEPVLLQERPDWVVVVGDVNSTLACALVCAKLGIPVAHVEAGLRSGDRSMPEEINRLLTDRLAELLFTPSRDAGANLLAEGANPAQVHFVGNVMIDTLVQMLPRAEGRPTLAALGLQPGGYALVTLHRPHNVDDPARLQSLVEVLENLSRRLPVVFPVHPRTLQRLQSLGRAGSASNLHLLEPQGYLDFLALMKNARLVLTDSGGVQEETTYLGVPCLTARPNTERPVTVEVGTNRLVPADPPALLAEVFAELDGRGKTGAAIPELWDGGAAARIVQVFRSLAG